MAMHDASLTVLTATRVQASKPTTKPRLPDLPNRGKLLADRALSTLLKKDWRARSTTREHKGRRKS